MSSHTQNVLVVYALRQHPVRETIRDHLYSFKRYSGHRYFYVNLGLRRGLPAALRRVKFDAIIFDTTFLSMRWSDREFARLRARAQPLKRVGTIRVAIPQDEFLQSIPLSDFINEFEISHVFTAAQESEWAKIYATVDRSRVGFTTVLTGYLEDRSVARMARIASESEQRPVDIGYRAWNAAPWLGRHGLLKTQIAKIFAERGAPSGLLVDISTRDEDTLYGDDWYRFLASCKYTIGVEGGASILDADGSIRARTDRYVAEHEGASFDEIEAKCFPGIDNSLSLFALSPRHLEACATRTCQILVEGSYNGVLRPGEHYIELRRDLANLDDVLDMVRRDELRESIIESAWRDVVASGRYSYRGYVDEVERVFMEGSTASTRAPRGAHLYIRSLDLLGWLELPWRVRVMPRVWMIGFTIARAVLPDGLIRALRRRLGTE